MKNVTSATNVESVGSVEGQEKSKGDHQTDNLTTPTNSTVQMRTVFLQRYMQNFVPKETMADMYYHFFYKNDGKQDVSKFAGDFEERYKFIFSTLASDPKWSNYLEIIFNNKYPQRTKECLVNGTFAHVKYNKTNSHTHFTPITFKTKLFTPIKMNKRLLRVICPMTHKLDLENRTAEATEETTRVANLEALSVLQSNLHEVTIFDRPSYGVRNEWELESNVKIPRKIMAVDMASKVVDQNLLISFVKDLKEVFSWENDDHAINYLGYLIQPMLTQLMPGQMPAYSFLGPTKSGKNFLSEVLVKTLYSNGIKSTAIVKKLLASQYELDVFLAELSGVIYIVFDEIKNASDEDLKVIDSLVTSDKVQYRKMRHGYVQIDNHFVVSLTSVHKMFTDETEGRLVKIELTQSTPTSVQSFFEKWKDQMPILLTTILAKVNGVDYSPITSLPKIEDRRSGFRLMSYFVKEVFGESPNYSVNSSTNDVLDELCEMYEFYKTKPDKCKNRYTPKNICDYLTLNRRNGYSKSRIINEISTALGYTSTRLNPNYKDTGYPSEAGKYYHIRIAKEKNGTNPPRYFIYIDPVISTEKNSMTDLEYVNDKLNLNSITSTGLNEAKTIDENYFNKLAQQALIESEDEGYFNKVSEQALIDSELE